MGHLHTFKLNTNKQTKYKQSNQIQTIKQNTNKPKKNTKTTKQTCKIYIDAMNE